MLKEICDVVIKQELTNLADAYIYIDENYDDAYFDVLATYSGMIARITKGVFLKKNIWKK